MTPAQHPVSAALAGFSPLQVSTYSLLEWRGKSNLENLRPLLVQLVGHSGACWSSPLQAQLVTVALAGFRTSPSRLPRKSASARAVRLRNLDFLRAFGIWPSVVRCNVVASEVWEIGHLPSLFAH